MPRLPVPVVLTAAGAAVALSTSALMSPPAAGDETAAQAAAGATSSSRLLFTFKDPQIRESSGIATSVRHPKVVFTHNDSGGGAQFFAVGPRGKTRAVFTLSGAQNWDWEDMSNGPRQTLWFGDVGANQLGRDSIAVYKVREPKRLTSRAVAWTRYDLVYDDHQSHNAEAMLVHPRTGNVFVVTKSDAGGAVYRARSPLSATRLNTLHRVAGAPATVTGGAFSSDGRRLVLRTYGSAYFYKRVGGHASVMGLPSAGESIDFARRGPGVIVGKEGVNSPVWRVIRRR
jgi:hypothetical protein